MNRMLLTGVLTLAVLVTGVAVQADDKAGDGPSIKEIMKTSHDNADGYRAKAKAAVESKNWDDAQSAVQSWLKDAENLKKARPSRGSAASWKKLTDNYEKAVKAMAKDIEKKNAKAFAADNKKINCGACHKAHKPPMKK